VFVMSTEAPAGAHAFDLPRLCRCLAEGAPQAMVAVEGPPYIVRYLNPVFARLAGKPAAEVCGQLFVTAVPEAADNGCLALLDRVFQSGLPGNLTEQEHRQTPPAFWSYALWAIRGADERPIGVMIQITDATASAVFRRQATAMNEALVVSAVRQHELIDAIRHGEEARHELEAQMFQAQKLESLGVLAGGIAHDLNNMLVPVLGYAELAANLLPENSSATTMLEIVRKHAQRAADLVQQVLAYAGKGRFVVQPIDLSALVRDLADLLESAVSINARLRYDLTSALPAVEADATQFRQLIINLVTNAAEAMPAGGGTITIRTGLVPPDPAMAPAPEPAVFVEVADTGCGMSADVMAKVFDPFFTTKFTGRGLGLAVAQGIVRGHRGTLQVRSEPGQGTTFHLTFPCTTAIAAAAEPVELRPCAEAPKTGTVLVIDDEQAVRDLAALILQQGGFTVAVASAAQAGITIVCAQEPKVDAVVLDLTMPGMDGLAAAAALRKLRPELPIILMSGFSVAELTIRSAGLGIAAFVQKPFGMADLLTAVRHALGP